MEDTVRIYDGAFGPTLFLTKDQAQTLCGLVQEKYIVEFLQGFCNGTIFKRNLLVTPKDLVALSALFLNTHTLLHIPRE